MVDRLSRCRWLLALAAAFVVGSSSLQAQQQLGNKDDTETPFALKHQARFIKLRDAEVVVDPAADKELLEVAGRYYVYRLTWKTLQEEKSGEGGMISLQKRFQDEVVKSAAAASKNKEFMRLFAKELIARLREVLALDLKTNHIAVTNAGLMLPTLAKTRQPDVHDFLMELVRLDKDAKLTTHPFLRMCAVRGLGEFNNPLWSKVDDPDDDAKVAAKRQRDVDRTEWLAKFIFAPYPLEGNTQEHKDALIFVRREGIKALAQAQVPAYAEQKGTVSGAAGYYLMYVAHGGVLANSPPLTLSERLEALIGLCQLDVAKAPSFNAELAVYVAADCLTLMAKEYLEDHTYFSFKEPNKDAPKRLSKLPWQDYTLRLEAALGTMEIKVGKDSAAGNKLSLLRSKVNLAFANIKKRAEIEPLVPFADNLRPASLEVFRGVKGFDLALPKK